MTTRDKRAEGWANVQARVEDLTQALFNTRDGDLAAGTDITDAPAGVRAALGDLEHELTMWRGKLTAAGGGPDGDTYEAALRRAKGNTAHCDDAALMAGFLAAAAHTLLGAVSPMQIWQGAQAKGLTTAQLTELIHRNPAEAADLMWAES